MDSGGPLGPPKCRSPLGVVVAVTESGPVLLENERAFTPSPLCRTDAPAVLDTTELRWFGRGPLPASISSWFVGATGVPEERCDTYLLDGRCDVGVKRRCKEQLELKVRQSLAERIELGAGLSGELEEWRRWSPAEDLVDSSGNERWVDVRKSIVKRRFSEDGTEIACASGTPLTGVGCDVEVVQVTVGAIQAWTFAFAAFGPCSRRRDALFASWEGLVAARPCPEPLGPRVGQAMGYPEWLTLTVS